MKLINNSVVYDGTLKEVPAIEIGRVGGREGVGKKLGTMVGKLTLVVRLLLEHCIPELCKSCA